MYMLNPYPTPLHCCVIHAVMLVTLPFYRQISVEEHTHTRTHTHTHTHTHDESYVHIPLFSNSHATVTRQLRVTFTMAVFQQLLLSFGASRLQYYHLV
jgi:hypothetical protein